MSIVRLNKNGSNLGMRITEELGQSYSWEVFVRKVINRQVVRIGHIKSKPETVTSPFQLESSPLELHDARIIWFVFIWSPTNDDSTDPYEVNIEFTQDGNVIDPVPGDPPPPHIGNLNNGQAQEIGDVFIFTS